jgi:integrase
MTRPALSQPSSRPYRDDALIQPTAVALAEYLAYWLEEFVEPSVQPVTYAYYERLVRLYISPALGTVPLDRLRTPDVQAWVDQLPTTCQCCAQGKDTARPEDRQRCCATGRCCGSYPGPRTVEAARNTLRTALNHARNTEHLISRNVAGYAMVPSPPRRRVLAWVAGDAVRFLVSARQDSDPFYAAYVLVLVNGLSRAEVLGLTWAGADLDRGELDVSWELRRTGKKLIHGKRAQPRIPGAEWVLPVPGICVTALRLRSAEQAAARVQAAGRWRQTGLVFTTRWGTPVEPRNFNRSFDARCARAGVSRMPVRDARRMCGPLLAALDVQQAAAVQILGHARAGLPFTTNAPDLDGDTQAALLRLQDGGLAPLAAQDIP